MAKTTKTAEIDVVTLKQGEMTACLLGMTPFFCNRVAEKAKRELLLPRGRMTSSMKAASLKHNPEEEFRNSPYLRRGPGPTRIMMLSTAPKKAISQAALDMPTSTSKAQIGRLTYVIEEYIPIFGIPLLAMDIVRSADINRTPDIRTRARLDKWATQITIRFVEPMLSEQKVATLLAASGIICGIGDWRQQLGGGSNGLFQLVAEDDPRFLDVVRTGGQEAQDEALANPVCANSESEELLGWYRSEILRRGAVQAPQQEEGESAEEQPEAAE